MTKYLIPLLFFFIIFEASAMSADFMSILKKKENNPETTANVTSDIQRLKQLQQFQHELIRGSSQISGIQTMPQKPSPHQKTKETQPKVPSVSSQPSFHVEKKIKLNKEEQTFAYPEQKNIITISKTDINRFKCEKGKVSGVVYSADKGIQTQKAGENLFVRVIPDSFAFDHPFEFYVLCDDEMYRFIINTDWITATNVILKNSEKTVEKGVDFFKGKEREQLIVDLVQKAFSSKWESNWDIIPKYKQVLENPSFKLTHYLRVETNGPWLMDIYALQAKKTVVLHEKDFVDDSTVAIAFFDPIVEQFKTTQMVIIRERNH